MFSARPRGLVGRLFGTPVKVSGTRIFARLEGGTQSLAYSMRLRASSELAMVLPVPVALGAGEDALTFVDLSSAPRFFDHLALLFDDPPRAKGMRSQVRLRAQPRLAVRSVGAFDASFVPSLGDFARLDPRFRLDDAVWAALPRYRDWGFAVFTLKKGEQQVHPMAFRFATREPARLFFPTVHVHDGEVHAEVEFDHELYWQGERGDADDDVSGRAATPDARGLVLDAVVRRRTLRGRMRNEDVWV